MKSSQPTNRGGGGAPCYQAAGAGRGASVSPGCPRRPAAHLPRGDVLGVGPQEVGLLDVRGGVAVAQEPTRVVAGRGAELLLQGRDLRPGALLFAAWTSGP